MVKQNNGNGISSDFFITQMRKFKTLNESGIFTDGEYKSKKNDLFSELINNGISEKLDDFLSEIIVLKTENILGLDDIKKIKDSLMTEVKQNDEEKISDENLFPQSPVENKLKSKFFDTSNIIIASFIIIPSLILLVIFLISDNERSSTYNQITNETKVVSENKDQSNADYNIAYNKYKYLEKSKLRNKSSIKAFQDEIENLGFVYQKKNGDVIDRVLTGSYDVVDEQFHYVKQDGKFKIYLDVIFYKDKDYSIIVDRDW